MARLPEYIAPTGNLQPSGRGGGAFSAAARRLGSLSGESAQATLSAANTTARGLEAAAALQARQPLADVEIANLRARLAFLDANPGHGGGRGSITFSGGHTASTPRGSSANDIADAARRLAMMTNVLTNEGAGGEPLIGGQQAIDNQYRQQQADRREARYRDAMARAGGGPARTLDNGALVPSRPYEPQPSPYNTWSPPAETPWGSPWGISSGEEYGPPQPPPSAPWWSPFIPSYSEPSAGDYPVEAGGSNGL